MNITPTFLEFLLTLMNKVSRLVTFMMSFIELLLLHSSIEFKTIQLQVHVQSCPTLSGATSDIYFFLRLYDEMTVKSKSVICIRLN